MAVRLIPDVERLVGNYLRASSDVQALIGQRVSVGLPNTPTWPLATIQLISGDERIKRHLDAQRIQVDAWGPSPNGQAQANLIARTLRDVLLQMPGVYDQGVVTNVRTITGISNSPDDIGGSARPRYTFDVEVVVHPLPS